MPKIPQKYHAIDEENTIIQAHPVNQLTTPLTTEFTILGSETSRPTRKKFISRVYSILWAQLLVTSIFIGCCNQIQPLQTFMKSDWGSTILLPCMLLCLILSCLPLCNHHIVRKCPGSGVYLVLFTSTMTYTLGYVGIAYKLNTLLLAGLSTIGIFCGLTLYAVQTSCDYTDKGGYLIGGLLGFIIFGFFISFTHYQFLSIIYASMGSVIFSFYIVYDTQLIVGGNHKKIMFHTDDYILGAISLYVDIINLFLMLVDLLNGRN
jgi:FtsH-binding integral membrane protein